MPDPVLDNFKRVIEERWRDSNEDFPIFPKDYPPPNAQGEWRPLDKMLVFFDIDYLNGDLVVTELSFSAIWREAVQPSAWNLFYALGRNNGIGRDLLPWHGERTDLTPAQRLLGAVEEERGEQARCLASRLRFSDAQFDLEEPENALRFEAAPLKILASPKPPCPALYLHLEGDAKEHSYLSKPSLNKPAVRERMRPNGRKFYLHHPHNNGVLEIPYQTALPYKHKDQKLRCEPIKPGKLWFHIDFDNLSPAELNRDCRRLRLAEGQRYALELVFPRADLDAAGRWLAALRDYLAEGERNFALAGEPAIEVIEWCAGRHARASSPCGSLGTRARTCDRGPVRAAG
ncbi:MAG: hypothetical protein ACRED0_07065 [Gammaproteobacteria bacterium]